MKLKKILGWSSALCLCATIVQAQETNQPADFDQRLKQMQEMFEKQEQALERKFEEKTAAQDAEIDALKKQIAGAPANPPATIASTNAVTPEQVKELSDKVDNVVEAQKKTLPASSIPPSASWEKPFSPIAAKVRTKPATTARVDSMCSSVQSN